MMMFLDLRTVPGLTIQEDGLAYDQTLECAEQPKPKRENNINGRWGSYFTGTILCSCSVLFPQ
jgi:hypothetical protein